MSAEILLTLKLHDRLFADPRRIELLKQIANTGSISQGAKQAGISYKTAWDAINEMNQLADHQLVARATGGKGGGGASLTDYGKRLIQLYDLLGQIQQKAFNVLQDDSLPLDSLLAAIARFSLQTSARNQLFATVERIHCDEVTEQLEIVLADGETRILAALTRQSVERLQLAPGKEVLVLVKAPWVSISTQPVPSADNQLSGHLLSISRGERNSEALIDIGAGQTLCATVANDIADPQQLANGQQIYAQFSADSVIIAALL